MSASPGNITIEECKYLNLHQLTFNIFVEILNINIYQPSMYKNYRKIIMNSSINFQWIINECLLNEFKQKKKNKYCYSNNFGSNGREINGANFAWSLYLDKHITNEERKKNSKKVIKLGLKLWNLPQNVDKILIGVTFRMVDIKMYEIDKRRSMK
eukprot:UN11779